MATLCETCPLRGECLSEIDTTATNVRNYSYYIKPWFGEGETRLLNVVQLVDVYGNGSKLFGGGDIAETEDLVEDCLGPYDQPEIRAFRRIVDTDYCGAFNMPAGVALIAAARFARDISPENANESIQTTEPQSLEQRTESYNFKAKLIAGAMLLIGAGVSAYDWNKTHSLVAVGPATGGALGSYFSYKLDGWSSRYQLTRTDELPPIFKGDG